MEVHLSAHIPKLHFIEFGTLKVRDRIGMCFLGVIESNFGGYKFFPCGDKDNVEIIVNSIKAQRRARGYELQSLIINKLLQNRCYY